MLLNPESSPFFGTMMVKTIQILPTIRIDKKKCILCGNCVKVCPRRIYRKEKDFISIHNPKDCISCLACYEHCPQNAITIENHRYREFFIARRCNNNCIMCFEHDVNINQEYAKKELLDSFDKEITGKEEMVILSGAEITTRKDLFFLLKHIRKKNKHAKIFLPTNGRLFSYSKYIEKFNSLKLGNVMISISLLGSNAETHDKITRVPGSFDQAVEGIDNLLKSQPDVNLNVTVLKQNVKELPDICKKYISKGIQTIQLALVEPKGRAEIDFSRFVPRTNDLKKYVVESLKIGDGKVKSKNIPFCLVGSYHRLRYYDTINYLKTKAEACKDCRFDSRCSGLWKAYLDLYGDEELIPVK